MTDGELPKALRKSTIFHGAVDCYLLEDGRELISGRSARRSLVRKATDDGGVKDGNLTRLLQSLPNEYEHLRGGAKVRFVLLGGGLADGLTPFQFADILDAYAELFLAGKLRADQEHLGRNAVAILRAASRLGLAELVSEALGTTRPPEQRCRERLFHELLRHEAGIWEMTFEPTLVRALAPLYGIAYVDGPYPRALKMPFRMIYEMVFGVDVTVELSRRNARPTLHNHHQYLRADGSKMLRNELAIVELLASQSRTKVEFWGRMRSHYLGEPLQTSFA